MVNKDVYKDYRHLLTYLLTWRLSWSSFTRKRKCKIHYLRHSDTRGANVTGARVLPCSAGKPCGLGGGRQVPVAGRPIGIAKNESTRRSPTDKLSWCRLVARIDGSPEGRPRAELTTHRGNILILCSLFSVTVYTVPRVSVTVTDASRE